MAVPCRAMPCHAACNAVPCHARNLRYVNAARVRAQLFSNCGFSMDLSRPVLERALFHVDNAYSIDAVRAVGRYVSHAVVIQFQCLTGIPRGTVRAQAVQDEPSVEHGVPRLWRAARADGRRGLYGAAREGNSTIDSIRCIARAFGSLNVR